MLQSNEDNIINTIESDIVHAETEIPDMLVSNNTSFTTKAYKPTSVVTVSLFIIIGLLAFIFSIMYKKKEKNKLMQCLVDVKSCYISYGSTNLQIPQFMTQISDIKDNSLIKTVKFKKCNKSEKYRNRMNLFNDDLIRGFKSKQITMVSDLWKKKSQQSNNYFLINIIPEEDEHQDSNI